MPGETQGKHESKSKDRRGTTTNNQASRMRAVGPWQRKQRQKRQENKWKSQQNDRKHGTIAEAVWRREAWCNAVCRSLTYKGAVRVQLLWCSRLREWGRRRDWGLGITRVIFPCVRTPAKIIRHTVITRNNTVTETQIWIQDQIWTVEYRSKLKKLQSFSIPISRKGCVLLYIP